MSAPVKLTVLLLALLVAAPVLAQSAGHTATLRVTATVVSSSQIVQQPDGSFRLVVANAAPADLADLQLAAQILRLGAHAAPAPASAPKPAAPPEAALPAKARY